ncbi:hypothetical protein [Leptospira santarosai]|uniref:hypothetical protein n=1 Tax=Leptospira santarosai TaxID=28183 RepID=UPI0026E3A0F3|nr:hypothetical protein [Leptospira santarosai]MDO6383414.1 hypothetical protein [Leptospira santarosai]
MALPPIPAGRQDIDWRFDKITGTFNFQEITSEVHTVQIIPEYGGRRGFKLHERPLDDDTLLIYVGSNDAAKVPANRQSRVATAPTGSQFFVHPHMAVVVVPDSVAIGTSYISQYFGCGSVKNVQNDLYIQQIALLEKLSRDGSLPMTGNLNFNSHKAVNLLAGTSPLDAVNFSQLTTVINNLTNEANIRAAADNSINSQLNNLVRLVSITKSQRDYAANGSSGELGMEVYAPYNGLLLWRNTRTGISSFGTYGNGDTSFQIIDTGSQFNFRWTDPDNALMEWTLIKYINP